MRYHLLEAQYTQAFLSHGLKWKDEAKGTTYGVSHLTKFHSAIVRGAEYSGGLQLTPEYRNEMDSYIDCMKREKATAKQNNQIEEKDADAIGINLYEEICEWAIEDGTSRGIVLWACSVAQWNCMGRPINIDSLGFHNIRKSPAGGDIVLSSSTTRTRNMHRRMCTQIRTGQLSHSFWQWDVTCVSIKIGMTEGVIKFFESRVGMALLLICIRRA